MKKKYYCVLSLISNEEMKMYKGEVSADTKPDDMYLTNKNISVDVAYFDSKKDRNMYYDSNVMDEPAHNQSLEDGAENEAVLDDSKPCLADKIESSSTRAPEAPSVNKTPTKEINPIR